MAAIMSRPQCVEEDGLSDLAKYCATYTSIISLKCTDTSEVLYLASIHEALLLCQIEDLQWRDYLTTRLVLDAVICAHHTTLTTNHLEIHKQQGTESIQIYLISIGNPIVEIRRSYDRLISTMGFHILVRWHLYTESGGKQTYQTSTCILLNKQGKSEGFDSCDRPSNLAQIWSKSSIFCPLWPWNLMDGLGKQ